MKKSLILALLLMGFVDIIAQVVLIRELLVTFYGNELSIGIILANWLLLEAAGSFFLGRVGKKTGRDVESFVVLQFIIAVFLPLAVYGARVVKDVIGIAPGEMVGLFPLFYSSLLLLAPVSLAGGALFTVGCRLYSSLTGETTPSITRVYIFEAIGAMIGGLLYTFLIVPRFHSIDVTIGSSCFLFISAILLIFFARKPFLGSLQEGKKSWVNILGKGGYLLLVGAVLLISSGYVLFSSKGDDIHSASINSQWRGYDLQYYQNSNYGNIAVTRQGDEFTFFSDGLPIATAPNPDEAAIEELAHLPMLFHPSPKNVLIIGGGVGGLINEVLKHPVAAVDYAELDPLIIEIAGEFPTPLTESELNNSKVTIHSTDGRLYLSGSSECYDVIIINLPSPSNLQVNRFYTKEFFRLAETRLDDGGILAVNCPGSLTYLSSELANLNACIYNTLQDAFPYVRAIPGESNLFLASPSAEILTSESEILVQRLQARNLETRLLSDFHIRYKLDEEKEDWLLDSLGRTSDVEINRDFTPAGLFYDTSLWSALFSERLGGIIELMGKADLYVFLIPLGAILALFIILSRTVRKLSRASIAISIVTTGFMGMAFSIVLILAYQSIYGYLFQMIALFIALFMVGLIAGSAVITRIMNRTSGDRAIMIILEASILAYSVIVPAVLYMMHAQGGQSSVSVIVQAVIFLFSLVSGILVGSEFPLANRIYLKGTRRVSEVAGGLYAGDLLGAWVGALIVSVWLIPVLGIISTCILIASLKAASLILLAASKI